MKEGRRGSRSVEREPYLNNMAKLKTGDVITVRRAAVLQVSQYDSLKPFASLTRTLGEDPEEDRDEMDRILYVELRRAVLMEVEDRYDLQGPLDANMTKLVEHCEKAISDGPDGQAATEDEEFPRRKEARKKTARKKARRRTSR